MRILLAHNRYQQRGGEDVVFENERELLRSAGHAVQEYVLDNAEIGGMGQWELARSTLWSTRAYRELTAQVREFQPDVVHVHNTLPLLSPAVFHAARREGVPVIQTLHNFRLICPGGLLFRDGRPCEDCIGHRVPLSGLRHRCYRNSLVATGAVAATTGLHWALGTWRNEVDAFIALTNFARDRLVAGGLSADRVVVKPNFAFTASAPARNRRGVLFVGRLSKEKGADVLLSAWERLHERVELTVVGDGPEANPLRARAARLGIRWLGPRTRAEVAALMAQAQALVVPSIWYEGFPVVVVEAFAAGLPVVASRLGSLAELVEDGRTGWHVPPGDAQALGELVGRVLQRPHEMAACGIAARQVYEMRYTPERNLEQLEAIYRRFVAGITNPRGAFRGGAQAISNESARNRGTGSARKGPPGL